MKKLFNQNRRTILVSSLILFSFLYYLSQTETAIKSAPGIQSPEWKLATENARFPGRSGHKCLLFKNKLWIIGGWNGKKVLGDIWFSNDGIEWKCALKSTPFPPRAVHSAIVYKNKIWVIGGLNFDGNMDIRDMNDVWCSPDGYKWTCITKNADFTPRGGHTSLVFKNRMWVIGGIACSADIWYSDNGKKWYRATSNAAFNSRGGHAAIVFRDRIWVIGGIYVDRDNIFHSLSDVWSSSDGVNWKMAAEETSFFAGLGNTSILCNGMIWVIGGFRKGGTVFTSSNGSQWNQIDEFADFGERVSHNCIYFKDRIWVIGGYDGSGHMNDIWYTLNRPL